MHRIYKLNCHVVNNKNMYCRRCFRNTHFASDCYAKSTLGGQPLTANRVVKKSEQKSAVLDCMHAAGPPVDGIYVLALQDRKYYVGSSNNVPMRIKAHLEGTGSVWTRLHPPVSSHPYLSPITKLTGDINTDERNETIHRMHAHGIDNVRGYR